MKENTTLLAFASDFGDLESHKWQPRRTKSANVTFLIDKSAVLRSNTSLHTTENPICTKKLVLIRCHCVKKHRSTVLKSFKRLSTMTVGIYNPSRSQSIHRQRLALDIKGHQQNSVAWLRAACNRRRLKDD